MSHYYIEALNRTNKSARHYAIDCDNTKHARQAQRLFCSRVNRLCKLIERDFKGYQLSFTHTISNIMRPVIQNDKFNINFLILDGDKIKYCLSIHGFAEFVNLSIETYRYKNPNAPYYDCDRVVKTFSHSKTWQSAIKQIKSVPFVTVG